MAAVGPIKRGIVPSMKRLLIMRHAKSDWNAGAPSDHERPLNKRGTAAAITMGKVLANIDEVPDLIYTSSAVRATETALLASEAGGWRAPTVEFDELYGTSPAGTLEIAAAAPDDVERLMLVGHQPTWGYLVHALTGAAAQIKTATVVAIDLPVARWDDAPQSTGTLAYLLQPRLFKLHPRLFTDWDL
jgi:phosphohistidine phosphatase